MTQLPRRATSLAASSSWELNSQPRPTKAPAQITPPSPVNTRNSSKGIRTIPASGGAAVLKPGTNLANRSERSEEHTSELQSRLHLVCRLLLEKKKRSF